MATPEPAAPKTTGQARYVLITECLQNDFFLNPECRLYLSDAEVKKLLVAKRATRARSSRRRTATAG